MNKFDEVREIIKSSQEKNLKNYSFFNTPICYKKSEILQALQIIPPKGKILTASCLFHKEVLDFYKIDQNKIDLIFPKISESSFLNQDKDFLQFFNIPHISNRSDFISLSLRIIVLLNILSINKDSILLPNYLQLKESDSFLDQIYSREFSSEQIQEISEKIFELKKFNNYKVIDINNTLKEIALEMIKYLNVFKELSYMKNFNIKNIIDPSPFFSKSLDVQSIFNINENQKLLNELINRDLGYLHE